jgi:large conductance mechanosensitive channel
MADKKPTASGKREAREAKEVKTKLEHLTPKVRNEIAQNVLNKQVRGFFDFLREQSVVGLAIGLILGTQAKQLVDQIVNSFINPFIGLVLPGQGTLAQKTATLTIGSKSAVFGWGAFVVGLITFVLVAAVVFYVFKGLKLDKLDKKKE